MATNQNHNININIINHNNNNVKEKLFKQWSAKSDLEIIRQVKHEKEYHELCLEFLALRNKTPIDVKATVLEFVVNSLRDQQYVEAEEALKTFKYDIKSNLFQICYASEESQFKESLLIYLETKMDSDVGILPEVYFENFEHLQQLTAAEKAAEKWQKKLLFLDLEAIMALEKTEKQELLLDVYMENENSDLLEYLDKEFLWHYYVDRKKTLELILWFKIHYKHNEEATKEDLKGLESKYRQWEWSEEMIRYAMETLKDSSEALSDCFAWLGYFDDKELNDGKAVLRRLIQIGKLPEAKNLLENRKIEAFGREDNFVRFLVAQQLGVKAISPNNEDVSVFETLLDCDLTTVNGWKKFLDLYKETCKDNLSSVDEVLIELFYQLSDPLYETSPILEKYEHLHKDFLPFALKGKENVPLEQLVYEAVSKTKGLSPEFFKIDHYELMEMSPRNPLDTSLNYMTYLRQGRSCYASYVYFLSQMENKFFLTPKRLFKVCQTAAQLILEENTSDSLMCHCVAFIEMLGFDSQLIRIIKKFQQLLNTTASTESRSFALFLNQVEQKLFEQINHELNVFPYDEYEALQRLLKCQTVQQHDNLILKSYAERNDWWHFLQLICFFETPPPLIQKLSKSFENKVMGEHFARMFMGNDSVQRKPKRKPCRSYKRNSSTKTIGSQAERLSESSATRATQFSSQLLEQKIADNWDLDIFEVILLSETSTNLPKSPVLKKLMTLLKVEEPCLRTSNLMECAIRFNLPMLSVLATLDSFTNIELKWLIYVTVATKQWDELNSVMDKGVQNFFWQIVEFSISHGFLNVLLRSFQIFFKDHEFIDYLQLLYKTQFKHEFNDDVVNHVRSFMISWSIDKIHLPLTQMVNRDQIMTQCIRLLLLHIQRNFESSYEVRQLLDCICLSELNELCNLIDFMLLSKVYSIVQSKNVAALIEFNFEKLLHREIIEYELILKKLKEAKLFNESVSLALILHQPIGDIIYAKWIDDLENDKDFPVLKQMCEEDLNEFSLPPAILVNFYLYGATKITEATLRKYEILKSALEVIKKHHLMPNETFDRDQIEYEAHLCYIQLTNKNGMTKEEIYHSDYYEQIMVKERCVLYKSFMELKELAGIDDIATGPKVSLTTSMLERLENLIRHLLDDGDIVQALRIQELFEYRPLDLRFIVYCMALAEDVTSIQSLPLPDRELLSDIEKAAYSKFNKRTLNIMHSTDSNQMYSFSLKETGESSDGDSTFGFEVLPSKEKKEILNLIQGIASKLKSGIEIGKRIVMVYRAAMHLDKEYLDVLRTKDVAVLLNSVAKDECLNRILVVNDVISSTKMTDKEISDLLALELTTAIIRPKFYIFNSPQHNKSSFKNLQLWGYNIDKDFHIFLELTPNSTLLGNTLLEYCDALKAYRKYQDNKPFNHTLAFDKVAAIIARYGLPLSSSSQSTAPASSPSSSSSPPSSSPSQVLSHKKQNLIYVELLIKAHLCFVHECSMEGIFNILDRTKKLNTILTNAKSWSLIVQMLTGIGRYREMFYCFDSLIENDQFESLLGQFDYEKTNGLRQGILAYIREHNPSKSKEILKLSALHFLMYKELADMWCGEAEIPLQTLLTSSYIPPLYPNEKEKDKDKDKDKYSLYLQNLSTNAKLSLPKLKCSEENIQLLNQALDCYANATENYLLDNKLILAQKSVAAAEHIAMQIDLLSKAMEKSLETTACVLSLKSHQEFKNLINTELSVPQAIILGRHYNYEINWSEVLLCQYIVLEKSSYLMEYLEHFRITDAVINNTLKGFQKYQTLNPVKENHITCLINLVKSVELKYKLASIYGLKSIILSLLNGPQSFILKDTIYGQKKSFDFHEF